MEAEYEKYYKCDADGKIILPPYEELPILKYRAKIVKMLTTAPCIIIRGETGSGKTTQVPMYIFDDCAKRNVACRIWITQPRKIAARTVSLRISERSEEWGSSFPGIVGYHVGRVAKLKS